MLLKGMPQRTAGILVSYDFGTMVPKVSPLRLKSLGRSDSQRNITVNVFTSTLLLIVFFSLKCHLRPDGWLSQVCPCFSGFFFFFPTDC